MVRINRVYTKAGDSGETSLIGGKRASKASLRIECYGTVDELNATIGLVRTAVADSPAREALARELDPALSRVQNELFNLGARLATPDADRRSSMPAVVPGHVEALETVMDKLNEGLPELRSFVLPGGGYVSAYCHLARTVCRRAERLVVSLGSSEDVESIAVQYLNRLSDALFVFGRFAANAEGKDEPLWRPEET